MFHKNTPIRRKLMTVILLTSGSVLLLTCLIFFSYEVLTFRQSTVQQLSTLGKIIAANSTAALAFDNHDDANEILAALEAERHIVSASLYDKDGKLFSQYPSNLPASAFSTAPEKDGYYFKQGYLAEFQPVMQGNKRLGTLYIKSDMDAMYEQLRLRGGIALLVMAISFLMAYLISRALQKQISEPILALTETAKAIANRHDFSVRATKLSEDELGLLTDAFNQMLTKIHELNTTLERRVQERTAQLEAVNKELEAFSYSVSHDLRAPLRHIDGFAEMLQQTSASVLDASGQRYLGIISESAKRMGTLIDDLLVFSRMGRSEIRRSNVKMDDLVAETLRDMADDVKDRNIKWEIEPLPQVNVDRPMLKQVWVNLLSNAVKYTRHREQAEIKIHCRKNEAGDFEFSVYDNGAGFDMQYAHKLFGVFQRLHLNEEFEGTGIGLANVRRIVLRHGGKTWAEGKIDAGATFYFTLPAT